MNRPPRPGHSYAGEEFSLSPLGPEVVHKAQKYVAGMAPREWVAEVLKALDIHYRVAMPVEET